MVEISTEQSMLVTVVTFLGIFFILGSIVPPGFMATVAEPRKVKVPEYFESVDLNRYSAYEVINLTWSMNWYDFDLGGWKFQIYWTSPMWGAPDCILFRRKDSWWIFSWFVEEGKWYNPQGVKVSRVRSVLYTEIMLDFECITGDTLNENYQGDLIEFKIVFSVTEFTAHFAFNTTKYASPKEAWENNELYCLIGMTFDKQNTTLSAWNLVGALLFFKMPDVHPVLNAIIAIPIWIAIAYLIYILILKAIPFVGG
ncbi:MAG: hypothetical protein QXE06_06985 [Candidatus Bathyarchaeia archaeon]